VKQVILPAENEALGEKKGFFSSVLMACRNHTTLADKISRIRRGIIKSRSLKSKHMSMKDNSD
jgi:hypothetical protein